MAPVAGFDLSAYLPRMLLARPADAPRHWREDATLAFVDISGFTKLSEQLAARGREGAEDLVSTLVRIFTLLLASSDDGGDVIKFGGDALLLCYTGPDHQQRACHATYRMQRMMQVVGHVVLTGARTRLRMSIGVHSDTFDFFVPAGVQQDLVVTGSGVTRVLELESAAAPGQILVSEETASRLPPRTLGERAGPGVLLRSMTTLPSQGSQILFRLSDEEQAWRHLPTAFRNRPDLLTSGSDHRRAAMAFVQVSGLDTVVAADPARTLEHIDRLADAVMQASAETGITVLDTDVGKDGYKYFLAAGAPTTVEDAEGRMIRALRSIVDADTGLLVRAGTASGRVFAGTVGAPFRCTYAAMGDTTNLAARLCASAEVGEVLAHEPMLQRAHTRFTTTSTRLLDLKGVAKPVPVAAVSGVDTVRERSGDALPFVGREAELEAIATALRDVGDGRGAVVEIVGEAGLGKSRLAEQALSSLGVPAISVLADPFSAQVPYRTLRRILRHVLEVPAEAGPEVAGRLLTAVVEEHAPQVGPWLPLLAPVFGADVAATDVVDDLDKRFRTARLHDAVRDLIGAMLRDPVALLIEDGHWVDESSAEALTAALGEAGRRPWAVLVTRREGEAGFHGSDALPSTVVRPGPLPPETAIRLVQARNRDLHPEKVEAIVSRASGNPFFLLELAVTTTDGDLPATVEELVGAMVDHLEVRERDVLRHAAVIGSTFDQDLYVAATGDDEFPDLLRRPTLRQFLRVSPTGVVSFVRQIFREMAYTQLSYRTRRQLHVRVARAIEERPALAGRARLPMLALHYSEAGVWDRALDAARAAGDHARDASAHEEAVDFYRRALVAGQRVGAGADVLAGLHEEVGDACQMSGKFDEATAAYRSALRLAEDPRDKIRLLLHGARCQDQNGQFERARRLYRRARGFAGTAEVQAEPVIAAEIDVGQAASEYFRGRLAQAAELAERAWDVASVLPDDRRVRTVRARAAFVYDSAAGLLHGPQGIRFKDLALGMYLDLGETYLAGIAANNLGLQAFNEGRWEEAAQLYRQAQELSQAAGDRVTAAYEAMNLAEILGHQGSVDEAVALFEQAIITFFGMNIGVGHAAAATLLADLCVRRGDLERAADLVAEARAVCAAMDSQLDLEDVEVMEVDLLRAEGRLTEAVAAADALLDRRPEIGPLNRARTQRIAGATLIALGEAHSAHRHLHEAMATAEAMNANFEIAQVLALIGELDVPEAAAARTRAEDLLAGMGVRRHPQRDMGHADAQIEAV